MPKSVWQLVTLTSPYSRKNRASIPHGDRLSEHAIVFLRTSVLLNNMKEEEFRNTIAEFPVILIFLPEKGHGFEF